MHWAYKKGLVYKICKEFLPSGYKNTNNQIKMFSVVLSIYFTKHEY